MLPIFMTSNSFTSLASPCKTHNFLLSCGRWQFSMTTFFFFSRSPSRPAALLIHQKLPDGPTLLHTSCLSHPFLWVTGEGRSVLSSCCWRELSLSASRDHDFQPQIFGLEGSILPLLILESSQPPNLCG